MTPQKFSLSHFFAPEGMNRKDQAFIWMVGLFLTCLVVANLIGSLLFSFEIPFEFPFDNILGHHVLLSAGIIPFPVTFILTDLLNEFYGKQTARFVTLLGFVMSLLVFGLLSIGEHLPTDPVSPLTHPQYIHFSGLYTGMFVASLLAYTVGQLLDIQIFDLFKQWTGSRYIWVRAQGSTVISQFFDSIIVTFVAFSGSLAFADLTQLALSNYLWKFLIVILITPLLYLGHALLRKII